MNVQLVGGPCGGAVVRIPPGTTTVSLARDGMWHRYSILPRRVVFIRSEVLWP